MNWRDDRNELEGQRRSVRVAGASAADIRLRTPRWLLTSTR